jgi:hypothetical protein
MMVKEDMSCKSVSLLCGMPTLDFLFSTKLDAEKRLALQEEKQALENKLLEVYVACRLAVSRHVSDAFLTCRPKMKARLEELKLLVQERDRV